MFPLPILWEMSLMCIERLRQAKTIQLLPPDKSNIDRHFLSKEGVEA